MPRLISELPGIDPLLKSNLKALFIWFSEVLLYEFAFFKETSTKNAHSDVFISFTVIFLFSVIFTALKSIYY